LAASRAAREPLSLVRVASPDGKPFPRKLASAVRPRLRGTDRLYRLRKSELLVIAPETRREAAEALSSEIERHLSRSAGFARVETRVIQAGRRSAAELVARLRQSRPDQLDEYELTTEQLQSRADVGSRPPSPEG
jgi:GGDEF domain-containing protein